METAPKETRACWPELLWLSSFSQGAFQHTATNKDRFITISLTSTSSPTNSKPGRAFFLGAATERFIINNFSTDTPTFFYFFFPPDEPKHISYPKRKKKLIPEMNICKFGIKQVTAALCFILRAMLTSRNTPTKKPAELLFLPVGYFPQHFSNTDSLNTSTLLVWKEAQ